MTIVNRIFNHYWLLVEKNAIEALEFAYYNIGSK